jgi:membrane peptidoglycan carboxypeptidase
MWFKKIKIIRRKRRFSKPSNANLKKFIIYSLIWFLWIIVLFFWFIYIKVIAPLPNVTKLEQLEIPESSIIYDREWNELYTLSWDEKRTYVNYDKISKNIINGLVSWEDKRYWDNPWIDIVWLFRALFYWIIGKNEGFWWTSTLTQQLIRNTIIDNRSSTESFFEKIERKIKEIYLAYKLTNWVSKEKILELYLNKISFWSNASWIEQASLTFFGKHAKDLSILEWSIMASIPKWPTYYSPYNHFDRLVWYTYVYPKSDINNAVNIIKKSDIEENKVLVW